MTVSRQQLFDIGMLVVGGFVTAVGRSSILLLLLSLSLWSLLLSLGMAEYNPCSSLSFTAPSVLTAQPMVTITMYAVCCTSCRSTTTTEHRIKTML